MEKILCGTEGCKESAYKFCFTCRTMLCKAHRTEDVEDKLVNNLPEHHYIEAYDYGNNLGQFSCLYCEGHPQEMLTKRCINCMKFSCNQCVLEMCPKAAGRFHDYDNIDDYMNRFKQEITEFEQKLQKKNEIFLVELKEACRNLEKVTSDMDLMLYKVDEVIDSQIAAIREDGEKLKSEILTHMATLKGEIMEQIRELEEKECESRKLLSAICTRMNMAANVKLVKDYSSIKNEIIDLLKSQIKDTALDSFELVSKGSDAGVFSQLELIKTSRSPRDMRHSLFQSDEKKTEIWRVKCYAADKHDYWALHYLSADKIVACGYERQEGGKWFTEMIEGAESHGKKMHDLLVRQLLPFGSGVLALTRETEIDTCRYKIFDLNTDVALYEYSDSDLNSPYFYNKRMAVTNDSQLLVLQDGSKTLHCVSLATKEKTEVELPKAGIKGAYGLFVASDGKIIFSCENRQKGRQRLVKYDLQTEQVIWIYEPLSKNHLTSDWLHAAEYNDILYIINHYKPTEIQRLSAADGRLIQQIPCHGLPVFVWDITIRGNTIAVAGWNDGIRYFQISDVIQSLCRRSSD